jgi:hypothetical protein
LHSSRELPQEEAQEQGIGLVAACGEKGQHLIHCSESSAKKMGLIEMGELLHSKKLKGRTSGKMLAL